MIGEHYWSTGIVVRHGYAGSDRYGWSARASFFDDGFCNDDVASGTLSTEGELRTRYYADGEHGLTAAINAVKRDAERLGVRFHRHGNGPACVYYEGDGEDEEYPPPAGWRTILAAEADRLGWDTPYAHIESTT